MSTPPLSPPPPPDSSPSAPPPQPQVISVSAPASSPSVTYTLIGLTVLVYGLQWLSTWLAGADLPLALGVKYGPYIAQGEVWRLVTPLLLHGGLLHIGFNMYALYVLGPGLERFMGHVRFALLYLLSGIAGNLLSLYLTPEPSLGASTAIFGLIAAQAVFVYHNRFLFPQPRRVLINILNLALVNFVIGLSPGIDNWGHLGGFTGGLLYAWFAGPLFKVIPTPGGAQLQDVRGPRVWWSSAAYLSGGLALCLFLWLQAA